MGALRARRRRLAITIAALAGMLATSQIWFICENGGLYGVECGGRCSGTASLLGLVIACGGQRSDRLLCWERVLVASAAALALVVIG